MMKHILATLCLALTAMICRAQNDSIITAQEYPDSAQAEAMAPAEVPQASPSPSTSLSGEELAQKADSAYSADNFKDAERLYLEAMATSGTSTTLFYNLGNAYYRQGNLGMAVVNYERALKLDPTNSDARANLDFVKTKITDKQVDSGSIMDTVGDGIVNLFHANTWAWIAVVLFALFLGGAAAYLFSSVVVVRKISFFGGIVAFLLCAGAVIVSFAAANRMETDRWAVVLVPAAQLSTTPREARTQAEEAFLLHEGTKVEIVDSISGQGEGKWYEVKVGRGERAWIKASEVERI